MEVSLKNSPEQCSFQGKREISEEEVIENASYISCHNLISSSVSHIAGKIFDRKTDVILLQEDPARDETVNCQIIELSDSDSKMILRQQLREMAKYESSNAQSDATYNENMEILRKLPPDTVVIKQEARASREDSDYRELMETNSSGSSSTSGCTAAKAKRFTRVRNKTRETVEVRRNPMRISKKKLDKAFTRSKRLLVNNKKEICANYEPNKRTKLVVTMPYMKTRSVTRKMYNVGATYQAPTKKDESVWKKWPVHGMHERPVYHPHAGLAVEYLGRYFISLDGLSYCEIIDKPEIEVVAVDPYRDQRAPSVEKKPRGKTKGKNKCSLSAKDTCNIYFAAEDKSFETCMHGSLHCVLGYCSQLMTPAYKQAMEERMKLTISASKTSSSETSVNKTANVMNNATISSENAEKAKLIEAIDIAQNIQKKNVTNTSGRRIAATYPSSSATYIPEAQKSIVESDGSKIIPQSGETVKMSCLKRILRDTSNNSLILLRNSAAKTSSENYTAIAKDISNSVNLKDMSSTDDKALTNMSAIYKNLVLAGESSLGREKSPVKTNLYTLKRYSTSTGENTVKKIFLENQLEDEKTVHATKENYKNRNADKTKINKELNDEILIMSSGKNSTQRTSETSEIARILSEYNNSTLRKSATHNQTYDSKSMKANMTNSSSKALPKDFWQKNIIIEGNQNFNKLIPDAYADAFSRLHKNICTMKRYNLTIKEQLKEIAGNTQNTQNTRNNCSTSLENSPFIDQSMNLNTLKQRKLREKSVKSCKEREIIMTEAKSQEGKSEHSEDAIEVSTTEPLQELLENTAILYCAASGVHQDDLSNYIDTLDSKQSIQWLESWNNSTI